MKKVIICIALVLIPLFLSGQRKEKAFQKGEWLRFKMSYSGFLTAGKATLSLQETDLNGRKVLHATGKGWTTGVVGWFFKVKDDYQSYFDEATGKPYFFKRNINEGGYKINKQITFDYQTDKAYIQNFKTKKDTTVVVGNVQDLLSSFYFLRNQNVENLKPNDEIAVNLFIDNKTYPFKLRFSGTEILETRFGKVKTLRFNPLVPEGRIFKSKEGVTIWITADANKIPIKVKANLSVGSLRATLDAYKGLTHPFEIIYE